MARDLAMHQGDRKLTRTEISYFAGILDADGSICIAKQSHHSPCMAGTRMVNPRYVLQLNIVNTSHDLMLWLIEKFGSRYKCRKMVKPDRQRVTYDWRYDNGKALWILKVVEPYLIVKKQRARIGIELIEHWQTNQSGPGSRTDPAEVARRERLYQQMKQLNQQGIPQCSASTSSSSPALRPTSAAPIVSLITSWTMTTQPTARRWDGSVATRLKGDRW